VLDREPVVEAGPFPLKPFEGPQSELHAVVARAVHVDLEPGVPQGACDLLESFGWGHPLAVPAFEVAWEVQLQQLGEEPAVGEHLDVVAESQPVGVALG